MKLAAVILDEPWELVRWAKKAPAGEAVVYEFDTSGHERSPEMMRAAADLHQEGVVVLFRRRDPESGGLLCIAKRVETPPVKRQHYRNCGVCAVPGCGKELSRHGSGVCFAHRHAHPYCNCSKCATIRASGIPTWQECVDRGMTQAEAAAARGASVGAACRWGSKHRVKFKRVVRPKKEPIPKAERRFTDDQVIAMRAMYRDGASRYQIGAKFGCDGSTAERAVRGEHYADVPGAVLRHELHRQTRVVGNRA